MRKLLPLLLMVFIWAEVLPAQPDLQKGEKPNILLFIADDMTWRDTPVYGNDDVETPNISRLAEEGMRFDNMFTATAMCSPTRQQLYTGLLPVRSGAFPNHSRVYDGVKSFGHHFKDLGYQVALIGKKHYGPPESYPLNFLGGRDHDNGKGTDIHLDNIRPVLNESQPFFLVIANNQPHTPWNRGPVEKYRAKNLEVPEYMVDTKKTRENLARYYAEITYADSLLGRSLDLLEEAGKSENTIVIFTSEQGSQFPFAKWTNYDLGLKTGFIARWPGIVPAGSHTSALTQYVDVIPTLLEAAGQNPEVVNTGSLDSRGQSGFDGRSFLGLLTENKKEHRQYVYGVQTTRGIFSGSVCYPIRSVRSSNYKYILNLNSSSPFRNLVTTAEQGIYQSWIQATNEGSNQRQYVMKYTKRPREELYDIRKDPYERNNLADNSEYNDVKKRLAKKLNEWMQQQGDMGIDTELQAIQRQPRWDEQGWDSYEEQQNKAILEGN
ncbi:sulfatase [Aliifodinibius sp. S!AR15-10]|uniref:sulfatase family protein n=1 Tax=Aliifodinibius sp. S!AR15-10 TaxID=2950437 RepID=UPI002864D7B4|nr:sulfatase [Aliifodinibius sp. S!AR15-10]MDR8392408.1 sulfatase [Aliifodinibius sp. S!AR15-10]